jgi:hypothetical protein
MRASFIDQFATLLPPRRLSGCDHDLQAAPTTAPWPCVMAINSSLPNELALEIFGALHSLEDVYSLSAASRRLRCLWLDHTNLVYRQVAPRTIAGEKHARLLQLAISGNAEITPPDVLSIIRRAEFVESIIPQFEEKVASRVEGLSPQLVSILV